MKIDHGTQFGLLGFIDPMILLRLIHRLPSVGPRQWGRLLGVLGAGVGMLPLVAAQQLRHGNAIKQTTIDEPPVFIIGHWRSGTTHLHNLLSLDDQFGYVRMFDTVAPACSLVTRDWLPDLLSKVMPAKRPMDNMEWPMDAPQEEEIALAKLTPYSWYLQFLFPQDAVNTFERYVLLEGAPEAARKEVTDQILRVLQTAASQQPGKRLLLKNPVNTARIPQLLSLFPDARFVYLRRSPHAVFPSTKNLHRKILELTALQPWDEKLIEENVLEVYPRLLERYLQDRRLLKPNQLVEVDYENLESEPLSVVKTIYRTLEIPGFEGAQTEMQNYLNGLKSYQKNQFGQLSARETELVDSHWQLGMQDYRRAS